MKNEFYSFLTSETLKINEKKTIINAANKYNF